MARGSKKSKIAIGIIIVILLIALFPAIMKGVITKKHPQIDTWYVDETGCFTDDSEVIIEAEKMFYEKVGIQPVVYVVPLGSNKSAARVYDELFDDQEHILIYITEIRVNNGEYVYTEIPDLNDPEASREYLYEVDGYYKEAYIGNSTLSNRELRILKTNLSLADIHGEFGAFELATVICKAASEIDRTSPENVFFSTVENLRKLIPTLLIIGVIATIVRVANKASNNIEYTQTPETVTPVEASKPVVSEGIKTKPIWETMPEESGTPEESGMPQKSGSNPAPETTTEPSVTAESVPAIENIVEPEMTAMDNITIDIKPIEPIKIEPVNFDFDANNVIDTNIDTKFDDWGNL